MSIFGVHRVGGWHKTAYEKIEEFRGFSQGWHYGEGTQFESWMLREAHSLNSQALRSGFVETDAFPGLDGEITVTLYNGPDYWEFAIGKDQTVAFTHEQDGEEVSYRSALSLEETKKIIRELGKSICRQSESFIVGGTIGGWIDFKAVPLSQLESRLESLLSPKNVYATPVILHVVTYSNFTPRLPANPRFIGASRPVPYRNTA